MSETNAERYSEEPDTTIGLLKSGVVAVTAFAVILLCLPAQACANEYSFDIWIDRNSHYEVHQLMNAGNYILGNYSHVSGAPLSVFVCDTHNLEDWRNGSQTADLYVVEQAMSSGIGSFNFTAPSNGTWYVVFQNVGTSSLNWRVRVQAVLHFVGLDVFRIEDFYPAIAGVLLIVVGVVGCLVCDTCTGNPPYRASESGGSKTDEWGSEYPENHQSEESSLVSYAGDSPVVLLDFLEDQMSPTESHGVPTLRGEYVRSSGEALIAETLYRLGVRYDYERPIRPPTDSRDTMWPDFTVYVNSEIHFWEHLGMIDDPSYRRLWQVKKDWYGRNGFIQNLIVTEGYITAENIEQIVRELIDPER